ncbi:MAG: hypothetical protein JWM16_3016 [Verrucomicrobiales bacterium]|nr:hypothetical protein [Verrucomicrobiales bacterium]
MVELLLNVEFLPMIQAELEKGSGILRMISKDKEKRGTCKGPSRLPGRSKATRCFRAPRQKRPVHFLVGNDWPYRFGRMSVRNGIGAAFSPSQKVRLKPFAG